MSFLRLLSTDFDGTLIGHPSDGRCVPAFAEVLTRHRSAGGVWALNTGRSLEHAVEGLAIFSAPVAPDFLLTSEREIFSRNDDGSWTPHAEWNDLCTERHDALFLSAAPVIRTICSFAERSPDVTVIEEGGRPAGLVTSSEAVMDEVAAFIERESIEHPDFSYQRNTVYLRFCHRDYHKGSSLGEVCRMLQIDRAAVLAAGDHFNDIPMLDGRYAAFPCCPSNAIPEVKRTVRAAGGHVAALPAADGIAEAWKFFHR
ncbi:MAG: HAD hydrolase family protein [Verrucomicrobiae bacterium]